MNVTETDKEASNEELGIELVGINAGTERATAVHTAHQQCANELDSSC